MPDRRWASSIASASASFGAIGFSHQTCLPASSAAIAISAWNLFGVVIETTSTSGSAITSRQSPDDLGETELDRLQACECVIRLSEVDKLDVGTSPKTGFTAFQATAWPCP